ncbi:MAG: ATP synthase F1 subunit delta [Cytophagales bacterium]|nr:MAG: ATP synthase F1 subunit delta [Cytophagales bacterium]
MSEQTVAYRYAKSLFEMAKEKNVTEEVHKDMQLILNVCQHNNDLNTVLKNPIIKGYKKKVILEKIFGGKVQTITQETFHLLSEKSREGILKSLCQEWIAMYEEGKGILRAQITTATPIDEITKQQVQQKLEQQLKKTIILEAKQDEQLIGGFLLRINDIQIDNSIISSLQRLKYTFTK